jgi:hypothetical protein
MPEKILMNRRLANEFVIRLARRALSIITPCLREEEHRDAFSEFYGAFKEELVRYERSRERMQARLGTQVTREGERSDVRHRYAE